MLAKRIIPCLDVKDGMTVKGVNFINFREAGDAVELGKAYSDQGADELVYLDITASHEGRKTFVDLVRRVASNISIPFTVGGGINEKVSTLSISAKLVMPWSWAKPTVIRGPMNWSTWILPLRTKDVRLSSIWSDGWLPISVSLLPWVVASMSCKTWTDC